MNEETNPEITKIAYNCRQATLLIEKKQEIKLTPREKFELKIHLAGCEICRVYEKQSVLINNMIRKIYKVVPGNEIKLDDDYKQLLQKQIENKLGNDPDN